jgi:hypothetical protein
VAVNRKFHGNNIRRKYGLTIERYDQLVEQQAGRCKICGTTATDRRTKRLHIDHDHVTGDVRGLLCGACNLGLGKAGDSPERLFAMGGYLNLARLVHVARNIGLIPGIASVALPASVEG